MRTLQLFSVAFLALGTTAALAQPAPPAAPAEPAPPTPAAPTPPPAAPTPPPATDPAASATAAPAPPPDDGKPKPPKRGDFDAGGQIRLPNGPDEAGKYATFNWVALDVKGRYFLLDTVTINGVAPLAVKKPGPLMDGSDPDLIGGLNVHLDAKLPHLPLTAPGTEVGVTLGAAYMREGAMLLSEKDFPLFTGGFKPGWTAGLITKLELGSVVDFSLLPLFVYQSGSAESLTAIQVPTSLILKLGSLVKVSADVGVYTGDNFSLSADHGGRITAGAALDVKIGKIITHAGAGFASLLTGGLYPTIGDSFYIDLNVKFAK